MSHYSPIEPAVASVRHDGWTVERRTRFLDHLAIYGDVRAASATAGMSREAAYRLRRRDHLFARAWAAALVLARENSAEVLATRAIDGIEEEVWYQGEHVGTKRKYDTRLLLAHMARLDKLAEAGGEAALDAARFDELLAANAGILSPPEQVGGELLAATRATFAADVAIEARNDERMRDPAIEAMDGATGDEADGEGPYEDSASRETRYQLAEQDAREDALREWDEWLAAARAELDAMIAGETAPGTVSTVSTSLTGGHRLQSPLPRGEGYEGL